MDKQPKLAKKLSPINVLALALGSIIGASAFLFPGNTFLSKAGPLGTFFAIMIGTVTMIIIAFNYHYMINRYPVAGGEFTYAEESFGRTNGFICSWYLSLSYLVVVPVNATVLASLLRNTVGSVFQFGFHYTVAGYDVWMGEILLAMIPLFLFAFLNIRGVKFSGVFQTILVFVLSAGVLIFVIAALFNPGASFKNLSPAFYPGKESIGFLGVAVIAPYLFMGFDTIPQSAEEFKFSHKKTIALMIVAILLGAAIYLAINTVTASYVPDGYATWNEYIDDLPNLSGIQSLPTFYVAYKLLGPVGVTFIAIAAFAAALTGICGFYMATSRLMYSMAEEKVIPEFFGTIHKKYKTPIYSILFILGISLIATFFGRTAFGWLVEMSAIGGIIGYGYTSAATMVSAIKEKKAGYIVTGAIGVLLAVALAVLLLIPIPGLNCSLSIEAYVSLAIWTVIGVIFFIYRRNKVKKDEESQKETSSEN